MLFCVYPDGMICEEPLNFCSDDCIAIYVDDPEDKVEALLKEHFSADEVPELMVELGLREEECYS